MGKIRYQALGPLLSGEGSRAFLGLEIKDDAVATPVVLVWVPEEASRDSELTNRVKRETDRAASLNHPNIIRVHGLSILDEGLARVVEFADGESLRKILTTAGKLPPPLAALVTAQAATGVHFAHVAGNDDGTPLVHGDLRPETILVSFSGIAKVSGYGALCVAPKELYGKRVKGRRAHCAPEQVLGGREAVNRQTDVYLLGLILYECLTGQIPFEKEADFDAAVLNQALPVDQPDVPEALRPVLLKACAKKAQDRYPTAVALKEALEAALGPWPLPDVEVFRAFLAEQFPDSEPARAARRREIDSGIAEFARKQWEAKGSVGPPPPETSPSSPTVPVVPSRKQAIEEMKAALGGRTMSGEIAQQEIHASAERSKLRWVIGALVLLVVGFLGLVATRNTNVETVDKLIRQGKADYELGRLMPKSEEPPKAPEPAEPAAPKGGEVVAAVGNADPPPPEPAALPPPEPPSIELNVTPEVEVLLDGKSLGRSPIRMPMEPGKYKVTLKEPSKGISTTRTLVVKETGKTKQDYSIGQGAVTVAAPDGAVIYIDGRAMGKAPLSGDLAVYEGSHQILVTIARAKWKQAFTLRAGERMYFNVETEN